MSHALRRARPGDVDFFYELRRDGFRAYVERALGPWQEREQRALAEREFAELPVEIVVRDGAAIGYQIVVPEVDHRYLDEIAIVASERGRGLGTRLVRDIMTAAGALPVRLSVLDSNPARRLYERLGFRVTRHVPPRTKMEWP